MAIRATRTAGPGAFRAFARGAWGPTLRRTRGRGVKEINGHGIHATDRAAGSGLRPAGDGRATVFAGPLQELPGGRGRVLVQPLPVRDRVGGAHDRLRAEERAARGGAGRD